MHSIALFPCCYTDEAILLGELCYLLNKRVVTDNMLLDDVSRRFGLPKEKCHITLFGTNRPNSRFVASKQRYIDMLKLVLETRLQSNRVATIHYGLHTSLLPLTTTSFVKICVIDRLRARIKRAMELEGFEDASAKQFIVRKDKITAQWTHFLFDMHPYDNLLHDIVISRSKKSITAIAKTIMSLAEETDKKNPACIDKYQQPLPPQTHYLRLQKLSVHQENIQKRSQSC